MKISARGEKNEKQKVVFTSLPGTCFKYSKHVRRQLAQGIHNQGAVETETSVQNLPGSCFNIPNMRAGSSPKAFITKVRLKQRPAGDLHVERGDPGDLHVERGDQRATGHGVRRRGTSLAPS